jgi:hypothetical protein
VQAHSLLKKMLNPNPSQGERISIEQVLIELDTMIDPLKPRSRLSASA